MLVGKMIVGWQMGINRIPFLDALDLCASRPLDALVLFTSRSLGLSSTLFSLLSDETGIGGGSSSSLGMFEVVALEDEAWDALL